MAKKINIVANLIDWQFKKQLKDLQNGKYNVNVNVNGTGLKNANTQMRQLGSTTQNTNTVFGKLRNTISNTFSSGKLAMTSYLVVLNEINKAAREAKDTILEMDKAVTDLSVAMNGTREEASEYVKVLNKQAIDLKTTTLSVTNASDAWLRQGKSIEETETLIRDSLVLSKVGKIESADATDYLTSALNGYKLEAEDAISVIDKLTAVDAESASEAGGLALSMSRTASAANMAGVSMDKLIGWLSVVKEVTRDSDEAVGNMAKTMLSRMNQVKAGKFIDAETGESLNDMEKTLSKVGIAMRNMQGQFISSEIVLDELGKKFNEFDSVTQRAIATQLGGTYQYEKVIALLSNYGDALKYAEISANSAGSAMEKFNESYMGSLEASQAQLQASFESLVINTEFEEVYADILEATKGIVDFVNEVNLLKGVASGFAVTGLIKAFVAFKTGAREAYIALNQYQQALTLVNQTTISTNDFKRLLMLTRNLSASQTKLILSSKNLTLTQKKQLLMNQGLSASEARLQLQNLKLATSYTGLKAATVSVTNACKGLFNTIKAHPLMLIMTLISGVTMMWESYKQSVEEANERVKESAEKASELVNELYELTSKYMELSKAVTTDENAKEDLLSTQDELLKKLGLESASVDELISKYGSLSNAIKEASLTKLKDAQIDLLAGLKVAEDKLLDIGKDYNGIINRNLISVNGDDTVKAFDVLSDAGLVSKDSYGDKGGSFILTGDDATIEGILQNYEKLQEAMRTLQDEFSATELKDNTLFMAINARADEMKDSVEEYYSYINSVNEGASQILTIETLDGMELPDTEEGLAKLREELIDTAIVSGQFVGAEEDIVKSINSYVDSMNDYQKVVEDVIVSPSPQWSLGEDQTKAIDDFKSKLQDLSGYLEKEVSGTLTDTDLSELLVAFPTLTSETDNFTYAIKDLMYGGLETLLDTLGEDVPVELVNALRDMTDESYNFAGNVDKLQSDIGELNNVLASVRNGEAMNAETMTDLISRYEGLDDAVIALSNGRYSIEEDALIDLMNSKIEESNTAISVQIKMTERTIEEIQKRLEAYALEKEALAGYGNMASLIESGKEGTAMDIYGSEAVEEYQKLQDEQAYFEKRLAELHNTYRENTTTKKKSSKSSKDDPWKDAFDTELNALKHNLEMEYITEKQYYDDLEKLNNKYFAGRTEYLDEYRQYEEEVYKGLKDYYKECVESNMDLLEKQLDAGVINYAHYSSTVKSLLDNMYADGKISAEDYHSYIQKKTEKQLQIFDKVLSAVLRRYDTEISRIEKSIESLETQNDLLSKQKTEYDGILSAIDSVYENEINRLEEQKDSLQEKIDLINEENESLDLQRRKMEALFALQQAQNQRTKKVLTNDGFVYKTDDNAIRNAQDTLQDIENEELISMLEKEQKILDESIKLLEEYRSKWAEISSAHGIEQNKQLAIAMYGANFESIILSNRISDIESFRDNYIGVQEQINDNTSLIESLEEKKIFYEDLKTQWGSISDAYEQSMEDQYMTMILGQNAEQDILNGRLSTLNEFKNNYIALQKQIAEAARNSANEQIKAAQEAQKGASGSIGSVGTIGDTSSTAPTVSSSTSTNNNKDSSKPQSTTVYEVVYEDGAKTVKTFTSKSEAQKYANKMSEGIPDDEPSYYVKTKKYHTGLDEGYVGNSTSKDDRLEILRKAGSGLLSDEVPTILKRDELVLTTDQQQSIVANLMRANPNMFTPNVNMPQFDFSMLRQNNAQPSISVGDIHIHKPIGDVDSLSNAIITQLPNKMLQAIHRK